MKKTRTLVITSLLIAITVILARFLSIKTDIVRISLEFLPIVLSSVLFGPIIGGITGALADVIGIALFPSGTFFPGFTISAFLTGIIYGLFLYKKEITIVRTIITVLIKVFIIDLVLVTTWLMILYKLPLEALMVARLIKCGIIVPVEILLIYFVVRPIKKVYN
ncbi:MAG: folate family ECF transporter S component [Clostridia bacterium]|nr:folate family ECF transporter S component [Clostridia bacterium]